MKSQPTETTHNFNFLLGKASPGSEGNRAMPSTGICCAEPSRLSGRAPVGGNRSLFSSDGLGLTVFWRERLASALWSWRAQSLFCWHSVCPLFSGPAPEPPASEGRASLGVQGAVLEHDHASARILQMVFKLLTVTSTTGQGCTQALPSIIQEVDQRKACTCLVQAEIF